MCYLCNWSCSGEAIIPWEWPSLCICKDCQRVNHIGKEHFVNKSHWKGILWLSGKTAPGCITMFGVAYQQQLLQHQQQQQHREQQQQHKERPTSGKSQSHRNYQEPGQGKQSSCQRLANKVDCFCYVTVVLLFFRCDGVDALFLVLMWCTHCVEAPRARGPRSEWALSAQAFNAFFYWVFMQ